MNNITIYFYSFLISFLVTFLVVIWLLPRLIKKGIVGIDMNKRNNPKIPEMGGLALIIGLYMGIISQIFFYELENVGSEVDTFLIPSLTVIIGISFIGIIDDLLSISQRLKSFLHLSFLRFHWVFTLIQV